MVKPKSIAIKGDCPHCGKEVMLVLQKKLVKKIWKAFKLTKPLEALKGDAGLFAKIHLEKTMLTKSSKEVA